MRTRIAAGAALLLAGTTGAQTSLLLSVFPSTETATLGDVVTWTFVATLQDPDPNKTLLAAVVDIHFDLSFGAETDIVISNNSFSPAFDSVFLGPADDGDIVGTEIHGASGTNALPPTNNPGGPDSSNPLVIYTLDTLITDDTPRSIAAYPTIHGQFTGAYEGSTFPDVFAYQNPDGSPGTVPFELPNLLNYPTLTIVPIPTPATASLFGLALCAGIRRRR